MYDPHERRYWLSGIGHHISEYGTSGKFLAPTDYYRAFIGVPPQGIEGVTQLYDGSQFSWLLGESRLTTFCCAPLPAVVHMRCWNLAQWVLGSTLEKNLELFVAMSLKNVISFTLRKDKEGARSSLTQAEGRKIRAI